MRTRRWTLTALVALIAAAFASPGEAHDDVVVDVEAAPYAGRTSGLLPPSGVCAFSPRVGTTFGGLAARARVRVMDSPGDRTHGWVATAQAAVEAQSHRLLTPGSDGQTNIPRDQAMAAASAATGYDWRYFGFQLGVGVREFHSNPTDTCGAYAPSSPSCVREATYTSTRLVLFPEIGLRIGRPDGFHFDTGLGAYHPTMTLRPSVYSAFGYTTRAGHEIMLSWEAQAVGAGEAAPRIGLSGAWPWSDRVIVGLGVAAVSGETRLDFDGRASVTLRLGR
jgi:hypothetical protein